MFPNLDVATKNTKIHEKTFLCFLWLSPTRLILATFATGPYSMTQHTPSITLLTDFGLSDPYVGAMKGVLLEVNTLATIIDIAHDIPPGDIIHGAFVLSTAVPFFPQGTVHVAVVDPDVGSADRRPIAVEVAGQYLVGPDNGLFSFGFLPRVFGDRPPKLPFLLCLRQLPNSEAGTTSNDGARSFDLSWGPLSNSASTCIVLPRPMSSARHAPSPSSVRNRSQARPSR